MRWILFALFLTGCADAGPTLRASTYPPKFQYLTRGDLKTQMQALARNVHELNTMLRETSPDAVQVSARLAEVEKIATGLRGHGEKTNHPRLDDRLELFIKDVEGARQGADSNPPNYYLAGAIAGACYHCHQ